MMMYTSTPLQRTMMKWLQITD